MEQLLRFFHCQGRNKKLIPGELNQKRVKYERKWRLHCFKEEKAHRVILIIFALFPSYTLFYMLI